MLVAPSELSGVENILRIFMEAENEEVYEKCVALLCDLYKNSMQQKFRHLASSSGEGVDKAMNLLKQTMADKPEQRTVTVQRLVRLL